MTLPNHDDNKENDNPRSTLVVVLGAGSKTSACSPGFIDLEAGHRAPPSPLDLEAGYQVLFPGGLHLSPTDGEVGHQLWSPGELPPGEYAAQRMGSPETQVPSLAPPEPSAPAPPGAERALAVPLLLPTPSLQRSVPPLTPAGASAAPPPSPPPSQPPSSQQILPIPPLPSRPVGRGAAALPPPPMSRPDALGTVMRQTMPPWPLPPPPFQPAVPRPTVRLSPLPPPPRRVAPPTELKIGTTPPPCPPMESPVAPPMELAAPPTESPLAPSTESPMEPPFSPPMEYQVTTPTEQPVSPPTENSDAAPTYVTVLDKKFWSRWESPRLKRSISSSRWEETEATSRNQKRQRLQGVRFPYDSISPTRIKNLRDAFLEREPREVRKAILDPLGLSFDDDWSGSNCDELLELSLAAFFAVKEMLPLCPEYREVLEALLLDDFGCKAPSRGVGDRFVTLLLFGLDPPLAAQTLSIKSGCR